MTEVLRITTKWTYIVDVPWSRRIQVNWRLNIEYKMIESNRSKQQIRVLFKIFFLQVSQIRFFATWFVARQVWTWVVLKMLHITSQLVLQQCCKTSYTFVVVVVVAHFNVALKQFQIKPRWRKSRAPQSDSNPRPLR